MITVFSDNTGADFAGVDDAFEYQNNPVENNGANTQINVFKWAVNDWGTGLIRFTGLSNISPDRTVTAAVLSLRRTASIGAAVTQTWSFYALLRNWVELETSWTDYASGSGWSTGGGLGAGTDRVASSSGTMSIPVTDGVYYTAGSAGMVADVNAWVHGTLPNYGWHIERTDASVNDTTSVQVDSSEGVDGTRPYLTVTHFGVIRKLATRVNQSVNRSSTF